MKYRLLLEEELAGKTVWRDVSGPREAEPGQTAKAVLLEYEPMVGHWLVLASDGAWREFNVKRSEEKIIDEVEYEHRVPTAA